MRPEPDGKTFVYIDGMNFEGSARAQGRTSMTADIPGLVAKVLNRDTSAIRYYTGLPNAAEREKRALKIAFLDELKESGIKTFANDTQRNAVGTFKEVGIDLKIEADMVSDFLSSKSQPLTTFMVVSNDTDYEPAFELIAKLGQMYNRKVQIINLIIDRTNESTTYKTITLDPETFRKFVPTDLEAMERTPKAHDYIAKARKRLSLADGSAIDASAHEGKPDGHIPKRTIPSKRGTNYYLDLNSLGATAKREFNRSHLDIDIPKLIDSVNTATGKTTKQAKAYVSIHDQAQDPVNRSLVADLAVELGAAQIATQTFDYKYRSTPIANDQQGPGRTTPIRAMVPNEKRATTKLLADVVLDILHGRTDDVVLVSDDNNLWPIAELAHKIARATNQVIDVQNVHFCDTPIARMNSIPISKEAYLELAGGERLLTAEKKMTNEIALECEKNRLGLVKKFGDTRTVVVSPKEATGKVIGKSTYWLAFDSGTTIALVPRTGMEPKSNVTYEIHDADITPAKSQDGPMFDVPVATVRPPAQRVNRPFNPNLGARR